jgi:hypothetical protein
VQDFKQSARTLTGTVKRALDASTDKANVDATLALVTESVAQFAVTINSVPNAILASVDLMRQFLDNGGRLPGGEGAGRALLRADRRGHSRSAPAGQT